jgi:SAM-dependent methyltransferase
VGAVPLSARRIDWTGERCVPWAPDHQMVYEHLHRYHFARRYCHGRRVLDLACGEGYGSAILAEVADEVVAVDIDAPTIEHARASYGRANLHFARASILEPDAFAGGPFDVVVCLEAIEHVDAHEGLLQSIKAALTPSGIAIISTPDRTVYSEATDYHNPFHVRELSRGEFSELLAAHFRHVSVLGQRVTVGSRIDQLADAKGDPDEVVYVAQHGDAWVERGAGEVPYLIAVASDLDELVPQSSTLIDVDLQALRVPVGQLDDALADRAALAAELADARGRLLGIQADLDLVVEERSRLEAQHYAHDAQIGSLEQAIKDLVQRLDDEREATGRAEAEAVAVHVALEAERQAVRQLAEAVEAMRTSRGWRMLEALRGIRAGTRSLIAVLTRARPPDDLTPPS